MKYYPCCPHDSRLEPNIIEMCPDKHWYPCVTCHQLIIICDKLGIDNIE